MDYIEFVTSAQTSLCKIAIVCIFVGCVFLWKKYCDISNELKSLRNFVENKFANVEKSNPDFVAKKAPPPNPSQTTCNGYSTPQNAPAKSAEISRSNSASAPQTQNPQNKICDVKIETSPKKVADEFPQKDDKKFNLEKNLGSKLFVWLGGLAMVFAGFFLIKYSIERGLFTPQMRIVSAAIFAFALVTCAMCTKAFLKNLKIASVLMGAGYAIFYADCYAASGIYKLVHPLTSLALMSATSVALLFAAKAYNKSLYIFAAIGIFLAPIALPSNQANSPMLLIYFAVSAVIFMREFKKQNLLLAPLLCLIANSFWSIFWAAEIFEELREVWAFVIYCATLTIVFFNFSNHIKKSAKSFINQKFDCEAFDVNIVAKVFKEVFSFIVAIACSFCIFRIKQMSYLSAFTCDIAILGPYFFCLLAIILNSQKNGISSIKVLTSLFVSGALLFSDFNIFTLFEHSRSDIFNALLLFIIASFELYWLYKNTEKICASCLSYFISASAGFITLLYLSYPSAAFLIALIPLLYLVLTNKDYDFEAPLVPLTLTLVSSLVFVDCGYDFKGYAFIYYLLFSLIFIALLRVKYLKSLAAASIVFALTSLIMFLLYTPQIFVALTDQSLGLVLKCEGLNFITVLKFLITTLLCILFAIRLLKVKHPIFNPSSTAIFTFAAMASTGASLIKLLNYASFTQAYTNFSLFILAELALIVAAIFVLKNRDKLAYKFLLTLCAIFGLKICAQILLGFNPYTSPLYISGIAIFNDFALLLLLPAAIFGFLSVKITDANDYIKIMRGAFFIISIALGFFYINSQIQFCFEGHFINSPSSRLEIYTYSAAWIFYSILLLLFGFKFRIKQLRLASFAIILLSIAKVFLFDASKLDGLARVFSFALLGLCLIGISYLYMRFALTEKTDD